MVSKKAGKKQAGTPRGFTFTISIVLLSITLIAMALFSQEWRKSQKVSFTELLPAETARLEERVSSDLGALLGADARVTKTSTSVSVDLSTQMPFKKEGSPIADMGDYASSLPASLRNTGAEVVLSANEINGSNASVVRVSDTGQMVYSNDGPFDVATYYHPLGWQPTTLFASIACGKDASVIGSFTVAGGTASTDNMYYRLAYVDAAGTMTRELNTHIGNHTAALSVSYPDGTQLSFLSQFSDGTPQNYTSISYTKSPRGAVILPLDLNSTNGTLRDYSENNLVFYLGQNDAAPTFQQSCKSRGCYSFGGNDYIQRPAISLTDTELNFSQGSELLTNGGFDDVLGTYPQSWTGWSVENQAPEYVFIESAAGGASGYAVMFANPMNYAGLDFYVYQTVSSLQENTFYTLSFLSKGTGGRYSIYDPTAGKYLQADGSWGANLYMAPTGASEGAYGAVTKEFALPLGSISARASFYASDISTAYYDSVSLKRFGGLNGGFEQYYQAEGSGGSGWEPEVVGATD
jgi:hypothetical protein